MIPTIPDRQALRALFDEAVTQINKSRPAINLSTGFYADTGDAVSRRAISPFQITVRTKRSRNVERLLLFGIHEERSHAACRLSTSGRRKDLVFLRTDDGADTVPGKDA